VFRDYTPEVERISIDEAFLDVTGSIHLFGPPRWIADDIRRRVKDEIGLAVSVGLARTKHLAKIASQVAKPDGLVVVDPDREVEFLHPLPVDLMWGVGPVSKARLAEQGITTIGDLATTTGRTLERFLGRASGAKLGLLAWNHDPRPVEGGRRASSVSAQSALGRRDVDGELTRRVLRHLADRVTFRLRAKERAGRTIMARVRFADLRSVTRSITLPTAVSATAIVAEVAETLVTSALADHPGEKAISLLAISVSHLVYEPALQLELPLGLDDEERRPGTPLGAARWALDRSVDAVRHRYGRTPVGYASVALSAEGTVPDAFRELAEREV